MARDAHSFSRHRLFALWYKEICQITRDPSSIFLAFVMPLIMMLIFGYGISFDADSLRVGVVLEEQSPQARRFADAFAASPYIDATISTSRRELVRRMQAGMLRGIVVIPVNFSRRLADAEDTAPIQVITDGSEPNTANFVQGYAQGVWQVWLNNQARDAGRTAPLPLDVEVRYRFNPSAESKNFIVPGAITIVMTVVGAVLTSLVIAREWERGTMEALLSTRVTRAELLLSKLVPYYFLGMCSFLLCLCLGVFLIGVPFRGSSLLLMGLSSLFLINTLGMGLLISTLARNQFNASQVALNVAFLPAIMLSGFVFEIDSMPLVVQAATYVIPARYYVSGMQTLFLAGNIPSVLIVNALFLLATGVLFLGATALKTRLRLD